MTAAWSGAGLVAYHPEKPAQFPKLKTLLSKRRTQSDGDTAWQDKRNQVKAWVQSLRKR